MNRLVVRYFQEQPNFEEAIFLNDDSQFTIETLQKWGIQIPKGWLELGKLDSVDRIEFTKQFWLKSLPYKPSLYQGIEKFFDSLDDLGPVLILDGRWKVKLVYSLKDDSTFFVGDPPLQPGWEKSVDFPFPPSWKGFMKIHNGFGKLLETGILPLGQMDEARKKVVQMVTEHPLYIDKKIVDPGDLSPFFEASGLSSYHCFFSNWYPAGEIGTVYFSGIDYTISDTSLIGLRESGSYLSFGDWLISFLDGAEMIP